MLNKKSLPKDSPKSSKFVSKATYSHYPDALRKSIVNSFYSKKYR